MELIGIWPLIIIFRLRIELRTDINPGLYNCLTGKTPGQFGYVLTGKSLVIKNTLAGL